MEPKPTTQEPGKHPAPIYISSDVDDYGLTPSQFRVYCQVARRAGRLGVCNESVPNMAAFLGMHPETVRPALQLLAERKLLNKTERNGATTKYRLAYSSEWLPPLGNIPPPGKKQRGEKSRGEDSEKTGGEPLGKNHRQRISHEVNPSKAILLSQAEEIYKIYPRRVAKPKALKAIAKALENLSFEALLDKTKAFAQAREGQDNNYCPYPTTWFSEERYNDDVATTKHATAAQIKAQREFPENLPMPKLL